MSLKIKVIKQISRKELGALCRNRKTKFKDRKKEHNKYHCRQSFSNGET